MKEKYKDKIRKLLALAQSENQHEAERARVQAEKMMSRYGIREGDVDVITVCSSVGYPRKHPKQSEAELFSAINTISGCHTYIKTCADGRGRSYSYHSTPMFMGLRHDAELAAYSWDVLYRQLQDAQSDLRRKYDLKAAAIEQYSLSWALAVKTKIIKVFGHRELPEKVVSVEERSEKSDEARVISSDTTGDRDLDVALHLLGSSHGRSAALHNAASDGREKQLRLRAQ